MSILVWWETLANSINYTKWKTSVISRIWTGAHLFDFLWWSETSWQLYQRRKQYLINQKKDMNTRLAKAWIAIDRLSVLMKSDLTDKRKCSFFQAAFVSILLYVCTTWTLTKRMEKKLDGNYTRMQFWTSPGGNTQQSSSCAATWLPSRKLSKSDKPNIQDTAAEAGTSSEGMYPYGTPHMVKQRQGDRLEPTYSSSVRIRDVALRTCQKP